MVRLLVPTAMVWGRTWLIFGTSCWTEGVPQPNEKRKDETPMPAQNALTILKTHTSRFFVLLVAVINPRQR
jgi:hypothetical protein